MISWRVREVILAFFVLNALEWTLVFGMSFSGMRQQHSKLASSSTDVLNGVSDGSGTIIQSKSWKYLSHQIAYEQVKVGEGDTAEVKSEPVLILNGFGVGSFHQHRLKDRLVRELSVNGDTRNIYGIDYLGQGNSWPTDCNDGNSENERGLCYSIDTWYDQVISFIEEVVLPENVRMGLNGETIKCHLVGNSVGGHLATIIASERPDLVRSISLLNATPVWGLGLPGWNAQLPPPVFPRAIGRFLFDQIRDYDTINLYLAQAYSQRGAFDDDLVSKIRSCTEGQGGHAAFASIVWSSPSSALQRVGSFSSLLRRVSCDVLLLFGDDDDWCKPAYAKHMMKVLEERDLKVPTGSTQRYFALTNTGHCPNHEAPQAVAHALSKWFLAEDRGKGHLFIIDGETAFNEEWANIDMREVENFDDLTLSDKLMVKMLA